MVLLTLLFAGILKKIGEEIFTMPVLAAVVAGGLCILGTTIALIVGLVKNCR